MDLISYGKFLNVILKLGLFKKIDKIIQFKKFLVK
jgi:hypothetical protein